MSAGAAAVYYSAMSSEQLRKECALAAILRELARYESVASRSWLSPVRSESDSEALLQSRAYALVTSIQRKLKSRSNLEDRTGKS